MTIVVECVGYNTGGIAVVFSGTYLRYFGSNALHLGGELMALDHRV